MKTTIVKQEENPFLERDEFVIEIKNKGAPTKEAIVEDLGKEKDLTIVRKIDTSFGANTFVADVIVYKSAEAKDKNLVLPQKIRKKMEEERKAAIEAEKKKKEEEEKAALEAAEKAKEEENKKEESTEKSEEEKEKTE